MSDSPTSIDSTLGSAIRAARFSRGLTQSDLAGHLGVTRATVASYETGRRKLPAETLIQIARLCGKPLSFFDPATSDHAAPSNQEPSSVHGPPTQAPALQALTTALQHRPDAIPPVMEFLEAWLSDQASHSDRDP
jgi:transcriptional regulator with XRE-family HTH domain